MYILPLSKVFKNLLTETNMCTWLTLGWLIFPGIVCGVYSLV